VLLIATLIACAEPTRLPPPEEPAARAPLFASDEEALAAATEAYEEYLAVVDAALQNPDGVEADFAEVATGRALEEVLQSLSTFADRGLRFDGERELTRIALQQVISSGDTTDVFIYVCESVANVDVLDSDSRSVVQPDRPDLTAFEVALVSRAEGLITTERALWTDQQFCLE
jgi:hypothetical protein